ncbi:isochorismatase family cysteine hydrolase [Lactiplantibacillus herbarum]|uniref:isochorismatase family cysteine hydrolase n=1 Tax=Lactiplantibacillus herbarum TaxID=1670446 RepID=UPI00069D304B|nr:isochorismatase family cysteine hydrolase [Lactiplantibacillus herbarum]
MTNEQPKAALVVIDIQAGTHFLAKHIFKIEDNFQKLVTSNRQLIEAFEARKQPIFIVTVAPKIFPKWLKAKFTKSYYEDMTLTNGLYLTKSGPSAFQTTDFDTILKQNQINKLIVTGFTTDNGVKKTVMDAEKLGYQTEVVADATVARKPQHQDILINEFKHVINIVNKF